VTVRVSDASARRAVADAEARRIGEIIRSVRGAPVASCDGTPLDAQYEDWVDDNVAMLTGYEVDVTFVEAAMASSTVEWVGSGTCVGADAEIHRVTLEVRSSGPGATARGVTSVVKRAP
jgi:hypothetical protein